MKRPLFLMVSSLCLVSAPLYAETHTVKKVIDGDTIILDNGKKVRLLGTNTPELAKNGKPPEALSQQATEFTRQQIEGKEIRLEFDESKAADHNRDTKGRLLAYVWYKEKTSNDPADQEKMLNKELIQKGYASALTKHPFKYSEEFKQRESEAQKKKKGIWEKESKFSS